MFQCQSIWVGRLWTKARFYSALFFRPRLAARPLRFTTLCRHQIVQGLPPPVVEHARHTKKEEVDRCLLPLLKVIFYLLPCPQAQQAHSTARVPLVLAATPVSISFASSAIASLSAQISTSSRRYLHGLLLSVLCQFQSANYRWQLADSKLTAVFIFDDLGQAVQEMSF